MYIITCIELNIVALILCLMVCFHQTPEVKAEFFGERHFKSMVWMTVIVLLLNIISWIIEGYFPTESVPLHMITMEVFYFCQTTLTFELLKYCLTTCNYRTKHWQNMLIYIPIVLNSILLLINFIEPFAFHIADGISYERLSLYPLIIIWPLMYILASVAICIVRSLQAPSYEKDIASKLLVFTLNILISAVMSALIYGFTPWPFVALGLMFLYLNVHSKQAKALGILAYKDALTGLRNATSYSFMMKGLDAKIQAGTAEFAIIVADVNDLKNINDRYGHNTGDQLLIETSRLLCQIFAHSPVHRIGGDEFTIILEGSDYENCSLLIKRLEREMIHTTFTYDGHRHHISIAAGLAAYDSRIHNSSSDVFRAADKTMYVNKIRRKRSML